MDLSNKDKCLIIAEAGVNHNGDLETALALCDAAKRAGADVIKFQTWRTERIITKSVEQADYQRRNTGRSETQYDMLKRLELSYVDFEKIKGYCDSIGIRFISTGDDAEDIDFLMSLKVPFLKIASGDIGNIPYLRYVGTKRAPILLSTGMCGLADIEMSLKALREGGASDITLLHCTTNYPCPYEEVNLKAMQTMHIAFQLPVGYSDHSMGYEVPMAAVALGARVIEKHFTLDRKMDGPDHPASMEPGEFKEMVRSIRIVEMALGLEIKQPMESERDITKVILKRIVAKKMIPAGKMIDAEDICVKRSRSGLPAYAWDIIIGTRAHKDFGIDEGIEI